ncbi:hypothetical protein PBI_SARFIRE_58 [Mycobacterium phage SarFire]|uniref:hypothetical protein n=1 Tax=Mycobacterium phage SarFire TaxID=1340827 RepID=UPI0003898B8E|nr:hypothetical protein P765_gp58 [Mycobacterium phage SarFire]AGT20589.1 hypothetical protein PBI_SARFIRE_58 [Mycobacterium phage SarFire]
MQQPWCFEGLALKSDTIMHGDKPGDFWSIGLGWVEADDSGMALDRLDAMLADSALSYPMEWGPTRGSDFDDDSVYLVYEEADTRALITLIEHSQHVHVAIDLEGNSARSLVPELIAEVERLRSYKSLPLDMVWQDYYSPDDVLKIRQPLDAEIEQLRAEVERLRAQETRIRELCVGDWIMVKNPLNDDKRERAVWVADVLDVLDTEGEA